MSWVALFIHFPLKSFNDLLNLHQLKMILNLFFFTFIKAIEACLRSLIFCQDANKDNQKNHDLVSLSYQVSIPKLTDLCREFQSQVCSNPDWMIFPSWNSVPGDRFTSDQVEAACRIAQQIVDLCDEQWNA